MAERASRRLICDYNVNIEPKKKWSCCIENLYTDVITLPSPEQEKRSNRRSLYFCWGAPRLVHSLSPITSLCAQRIIVCEKDSCLLRRPTTTTTTTTAFSLKNKVICGKKRSESKTRAKYLAIPWSNKFVFVRASQHWLVFEEVSLDKMEYDW